MGMPPPPGAKGPMSEPFDPYRKWLGIPPKDQPPHHYRLLGIATFESDADVIENAANRQMAHVKTFKGGKHAALSQKILTELSAAKLCLLTPDHKQAYDAQLRAQLAAAGKLSDSMVLSGSAARSAAALGDDDRWRTDEVATCAPPGPPPVPIPMPVGTAVPTVPMIRGSKAAALRGRRKRSTLPLAITVVSLCVLFATAGVAALVYSGVLNDLGGSPAKAPAKAPVKAPVTAPRKSQATAFPIGTAAAAAEVPPQEASAAREHVEPDADDEPPPVDRVRQALFLAEQARAAGDQPTFDARLMAAELALKDAKLDEAERKALTEQIEELRKPPAAAPPPAAPPPE